MRLAPDQAHRTTAKLTKWCRRRLLFEVDDLVHAADAKARVTIVNSVSLQPMFAPTQAFAPANPLAWPWTQQFPEPIEPFAVYTLLELIQLDE